MTLPEAEYIANEFNKFTSVQSAEVVPNVGGDYSVLVTRTDGRRAISPDLNAANAAHAALQIEESYAQAVYATLGEGNVPVLCSRETWKAWWEENAGGKVVKSEQSGDFVSEIIFTGFPPERDRSPNLDAALECVLKKILRTSHSPRRPSKPQTRLIFLLGSQARHVLITPCRPGESRRPQKRP